MSKIDVEALARELLSAQESGRMVPAPPSSNPDFDLDTAYAVETAIQRMRERGGHRVVGRKVGYANKAVWRLLKLQTLVWGSMYEDTVHQSHGNAIELELKHIRSLKVEPEIVFGLKDAVRGAAADGMAALEATEWLAIGFEIIDCPFPDWKFQPSDFVASLGLHAALVIGERVGVHAENIPQLVDELAKFKVRVLKNGEFVEEGSGRNSLRSPALCLAELGAAMAQHSPAEPLAAGEIVSSGTLTAGHLAEPGDQWKVEIDGLNLAGLTLHLK
jgi:2-keto-4-pentenoate hydratase